MELEISLIKDILLYTFCEGSLINIITDFYCVNAGWFNFILYLRCESEENSSDYSNLYLFKGICYSIIVLTSFNCLIHSLNRFFIFKILFFVIRLYSYFKFFLFQNNNLCLILMWHVHFLYGPFFHCCQHLLL